MARVTIEDCVNLIPNRFELILIAAERARALAGGSALLVARDNDKNPVVALREIADKKLDLDAVRQAIIKGLQKVSEPDEIEEEVLEAISEEQNWIQDPESEEMRAEIFEDSLEIEDEAEINNTDDLDSLEDEIT